MLSDGYLFYGGVRAKNVTLRIKHSLNQFSYVWHLFNLLSHFGKSFPVLEFGKRNEMKTVGIYFYTRTLPCFT
jgi:hypothetical protein